MGVSKNRGNPKSSILIGFSIINHPFWGTIICGNTHISIWKNPSHLIESENRNPKIHHHSLPSRGPLDELAKGQLCRCLGKKKKHDMEKTRRFLWFWQPVFVKYSDFCNESMTPTNQGVTGWWQLKYFLFSPRPLGK